MNPELASTPCPAARVPSPEYEKEADYQQQETVAEAAAAASRRGRRGRRRLRRSAFGIHSRRCRAGSRRDERLERTVPAAGIAGDALRILVPEPVPAAPVHGAGRVGVERHFGKVL